MSDLWYWRSNERIRGPLVTEELEAIVLNQRLADSDSVRLDGSDEWIPAAEIRRMFLQSTSTSPAETAAKLLETAAARRLQGSAAHSKGSGLGGLVGRLTDGAGSFASSLVQFVAWCFQLCTSWLGRRGRLVVTAVAGIAVLGFLLSWLAAAWGPRDTTRLLEAEDLWEHVQANALTGFPLPAQIAQRLDALESELEKSLRDQPVSGASGADRRSSLGLRELLYAVRDMQASHANLDDPARERIDQTLHAASNYLSGAAEVSGEPVVASESQGRWSSEIIAILIFDAVLAFVVAGWWIMSRGRG